MNSRPEDLTLLQAQLAEKNDLVAALTAQLERTATQLDRLTRSGAERSHGNASPGNPAPVSPELSGKLVNALEEWQEFQPTERIERIETGIDRILELLESQAQLVSQPHSDTGRTVREKPDDDFWTSTKARLLGESSETGTSAPFASGSSFSAEESFSNRPSQTTVPSSAGSADPLMEIGAGPEPPAPVTNVNDPEELQAGVKTRDIYIQYLIFRLRMAESKSYFPPSWDNLAPPDRERIEALETVLKDHLRQAEVAHSLERALLARERAKLAQIKQNLEIQIKKMVLPTSSPAAPPEAVPDQKLEQKGEQESRWKRIFSR